ncbi:ribonucleotide diphosphate reductase alpha subunit [Lactococcus phage LW81]|uniref:Ribonucleotide diphosphate reductase alpha subunit n=1 Tax=Lactococcus phage LW81 TaxID=1965482 RepID=A0A1W6JNB4_9CAUD|nr:ribonucleotide reductase large subunit [Lactococcus phage LW81]ARM67702.1 ribonucleotide diphosphate reductase alpha subunit [Lactococcus phage LW81]
MEIKDVVIIGGGVAGTTVALYLARAGFEPLLLTDGEIGGNLNSIDTIQNYVGIYNAKGSDITEAIRSQLYQAGILNNVKEDTKVTNVSKDKNGLYMITYENLLGAENIVMSKNLVIATGQHNLKLPIDVEQHNCVLCDGFMFKGEPVVVIGGGNSALTEAIELAKTSSKVYLVTRRPEFRAEQHLQNEIKEHDNIVHSVGNLQSVVGDSYIFDTHTLIAKGLFVYIGSKPNTQFMEDELILTDSGHIETMNHNALVGVKGSRHMNIDRNLYVVGDVNGAVEAKQFGIAIGQATEVAVQLIKKLS